MPSQADLFKRKKVAFSHLKQAFSYITSTSDGVGYNRKLDSGNRLTGSEGKGSLFKFQTTKQLWLLVGYLKLHHYTYIYIVYSSSCLSAFCIKIRLVFTAKLYSKSQRINYVLQAHTLYSTLFRFG